MDAEDLKSQVEEMALRIERQKALVTGLRIGGNDALTTEAEALLAKLEALHAGLLAQLKNLKD